MEEAPGHGADFVEKVDGGFGLSGRGSLDSVGKGTSICAVFIAVVIYFSLYHLKIWITYRLQNLSIYERRTCFLN